MTHTLDAHLKTILAAKQAQHLFRHYYPRHGKFTAMAAYANNEYLAFINNDYLGLAHHPALVKAAARGLDVYGVGSSAAHGIGGHCQIHQELEQALALFLERPAVLVFSSGYMANLGVLSSLVSAQDSVFADRLVHASLIDGMRLSGARLVRYHHNNIAHLQTKLSRYAQGHRLIMSDGVFSMDGDIALLPELVLLAREHQAWLMIDDAHGIGVLGKQGGGCCEHFGLTSDDAPILVGTLSKAFGSYGAFVAGSEVLIEAMRQLARPYMFTTALPPLLAEASLTSLKIIQEETWRREYLQDIIQYFRRRANEFNLPLMPSSTPIQPIILGDNRIALEMQSYLRERGILVAAIRPPTVPVNTARLRISLNVLHTHAHIDRLLEIIQQGLAR